MIQYHDKKQLGRELKQKTLRNAVTGLSGLFSDTTQVHLPKDGPTPCGLSQPRSIINQENGCPTTFPKGQSSGDIFSNKASSSQMT